MKKALSLIIAVLIVAATFIAAIPVGAESYSGNLDFSLTNAAGYQNDEITIDLNIDKNTGFFAFIIYLYYDSDVFILRDVTYNDKLVEQGEFMKTNNNVSYDKMGGTAWEVTKDRFKQYNVGTSNKDFKLLYYEVSDLGDSDFTGTVATLTFQIMGIAEDGDYEIGIMPSPGNCISYDSNDDLLVSWVNAKVRVGDEKVPKETEEPVNMTDTVAPDKITEEPETKSREQIESEAFDDTDTSPAIETVKGEDGNIYVINDAGETELYEPDKEAPESTDKATDDAAEDSSTDTDVDAETETDVAGEAKADEKNTINLFGLKIPLVYFIAAILLILIAVAAVLFFIISKTKKSDKELDQ